MKRKYVGALGVLSLGAASLLGTASAAYAQGEEGVSAQDVQVQFSCPSVSLCLFQYDNYGGSKLVIPENKKTPSLAARGFDNKASSMANQTGSEVILFQLANYSGVSYTAKPVSYDKTFSNNNFDNRASSVYWR
ncbi:peptidase inhibitor family I36 protein [Streptomyces sp. NPDC048172]|uniref:peptidase inhibitor family I36 protein n=1 Tax=Streptomyces sp. NPDC048172 TaxID=3365505 RepID=UPI00371A0275